MIKIGNGSGFWGDQVLAPIELLIQQPDLDFLTLDYLSEVSLSIMAIQREKDPSAGFAKDFLKVIKGLIPHWKRGSKVRVIANAGGLNPLGCAQGISALLEKEGLSFKVGVVDGDDALKFLRGDPQNPLFSHMDTGNSLETVVKDLVTANAYFGAKPVADLLRQGAQIVVTGRLADPSLTVAPCIHSFGWKEEDYNPLAGATVAGHLIECGTQATGGIATDWLQMPHKEKIGFPFVEVEADGTFVLTKPEGTGGAVNLRTVKEQLLYEIGDPAHYISPDVQVSFLGLQLEEVGKDRVRVTGALGSPATPLFKVNATYRRGYRAEGMLTIVGDQAPLKAKICGEIILERVKAAGFCLNKSQVDCVGSGAIFPSVDSALKECLLRVAASDERYEAMECFAAEFAPLVTSGPSGTTGYASGRPPIRPVFGCWPCLIEKEKIRPRWTLI